MGMQRYGLPAKQSKFSGGFFALFSSSGTMFPEIGRIQVSEVSSRALALKYAMGPIGIGHKLKNLIILDQLIEQ